MIRLDYQRFGQTDGSPIGEHQEFGAASEKVVNLHSLLIEGKSSLLKDKDVTMTGWKMDSPYVSPSELDAIDSCAAKLVSEIDDFISIGIGGSYLGIQASIDAVRGSLELFNLLSPKERKGTPRIFFLGHNMDPAYTARILEIVNPRKLGAAVISKSGGTVEPAVAFAIVKKVLEENLGKEIAAQRIVAITDKAKGSLKKLADELGYRTFVVPDNVGGRFSVTCPVGLFALAVAGINIKEFIAGARAAEEDIKKQPFDKNISMLRAVLRFIAHKYLGFDIELASTCVYDLRSTTMWMQQLGPESEGKHGEGLFIVPQYFTRDAHADGQLIQEGKRNLIELFLMLEKPAEDIIIPAKGTPVEYLDGKTLHFVNTAFVEGLRDAHHEGGVPTMSYILPKLDAYTMGMLYQYEMNAIALSGLLLGQNPFIQPGVQMYKDIANAKSGKPVC
ncbi:MAG: glucose-6-phosphate isomerase [Candidatus Saganbacteria bacterium]|nr:glucose-6-phosphate isomerase [Candidatus Saganbacteria bacterium]